MIDETQVVEEGETRVIPERPGPEIRCTYPNRVCWSAIFVGALVGVGLSFLLNLFAIAIGLSAVTVGKTGAMVLTLTGILGVVLGNVVAMIAAGYAAGFLGRGYCLRNLGLLYGFTTWCVALLLSSIILSHMSHYTSNYSQAIVGKNVMTQPAEETVAAGKVESGAVKHKANEVPSPSQNEDELIATTLDWAYGAAVIFALFLIGAVSTCIGASWAMRQRTEEVV